MSLSARILLDHLSQLNIEKQILCREEQRERILRKRATVNASFYVFQNLKFSVILDLVNDNLRIFVYNYFQNLERK